MSKTAEEIKDQVAKKYYTRGDRLLISWEDAISEYCKGYLSELMFERIINESMEAYHTAKLEEVKGLPSVADLIKEFGATDSSEGDKINRMWLEGAKQMRSIAQSVIAKEREENQRLNDGLKYCHKRMAEAYKEISTLKAEIERLKQGKCFECNELLDKEELFCTYCRKQQ